MTWKKIPTPERAPSVGGESSSSSHTSDSTPNPWKYHVFLSFAGKDTRLKFTGHLDEAFNRSGIKTFRDDVDLEKGEDIKEGLFHAIEDSLCAVLVISKNYAESGWCLEEIEKILECRNKLGQLIFPIFYDVNPGDVKNLRNSFGDALAKHEKTFKENEKRVQNWRNVLSQIGSISGEDTRGKHEADLIKDIVAKVWTYISSKLPSDDNNLVGIKSRVDDMMRLLEIGLDESLFVGIWGMGGVGKSTLARVVSEKLSHMFEATCFLANVRETLLQREGLVSLQNRLLSHLKIKNMKIDDDHEGMKKISQFLCNKKVFLVIDDVDDMSQLNNLAESPNWFGKGSRIIITTRNSRVLRASGVKEERIYEMKTMMEHESLQLFSNKAFHRDHPEDDFLELSKSVVEYAGGLPLALSTLGSSLYGREKDEWEETLDRLKKISNKDILQVLRISYDGLEDDQKTIFLDIACFFKGWPKEAVTQILKSCGFRLKLGIKVLIEKALLVETKDCRIEMHDLLEDLGRHIVHEESSNVGERSRLWKFEDVKEVLEKNMGSKAIQAIVLRVDFGDKRKIKIHPEAFSKMSNIRLLYLKLHHASESVLQQPCSLEAITLGLWNVIFCDNQVKFDLKNIFIWGARGFCYGIKQFWNNQQAMDLSGSLNFSETPDFSGVPNLEYLYLQNCRSLVKVHDSLGKLKALVEVDLSDCENLEILPKKLETNSLVKLDLRKCQKVAKLPEFGEGMKKLSILDVSYTAVIRLPKSFGSLTGLKRLSLDHCKILNLKEWGKAHISRQVSRLDVMSLTELSLRKCDLNDGSIPVDFGSLSSSLVILDLSHNDFVNLPNNCFSSLDRLAILSLDGCANLKSLPRLPPRLIRLNAFDCYSMKPLSNIQLWNVVASLDHENRGRTKFVMSEVENDDIPLRYIEAEKSLLLRDFCAIIPAISKEIPSWFGPNKIYYDAYEYRRREFEIQVGIPQHFHHNEWSGLVVCFLFVPYDDSYGLSVKWSSKGAEDDDYIFNECAHNLGLMYGERCHMWMMVLELNEETCWRHLRRSHHNSLHIKLTTCWWSGRKLGCGWRVICKKEIKKWCTLNNFNQPLLPSPHHDPRPLSSAMLDSLIVKQYY